LCAQTIVADITLPMRREATDRWIALTMDQFGKPENDLAHGNDSLLLANLIHITRQIFYSCSGTNGKWLARHHWVFFYHISNWTYKYSF
jgi:hypothetical protein